MLIDWFKFSAALLLLVTPIGLFHGKEVRYLPLSREWSRYWSQMFSLGLHAIDLLRAALGAWLLGEALMQAPGAAGLMRHVVTLTQAAVLGVAVAMQVFVCKEPESAHAPFAFALGLVAGGVPPTAAAFALTFAIVITAGSRTPMALFPLLALSVAGAGLLFQGRNVLPASIALAFAVSLPWLLTLLFSRHLVVSYRPKTKPAARPPSPPHDAR